MHTRKVRGKGNENITRGKMKNKNLFSRLKVFTSQSRFKNTNSADQWWCKPLGGRGRWVSCDMETKEKKKT